MAARLGDGGDAFPTTFVVARVAGTRSIAAAKGSPWKASPLRFGSRRVVQCRWRHLQPTPNPRIPATSDSSVRPARGGGECYLRRQPCNRATLPASSIMQEVSAGDQPIRHDLRDIPDRQILDAQGASIGTRAPPPLQHRTLSRLCASSTRVIPVEAAAQRGASYSLL
jgi:hypothetical protein